jgi:hypothetical protein
MRKHPGRWVAALPLLLLAFACTDDPETDVEPDAAAAMPDAVIVRPDGAVVIPDAVIALPDAAIAVPDATVALPDAVIAVPDAAIAVPDAAVALPDAAVALPDAAVALPPDAEPPPPGVCVADVLQRPAALADEALVDVRCPAGMVYVATFCVDRYEAALVEDTPGGAQPWSPYHSPGDRAVRAVSVEGAVPQGYISGAQAGVACVAAGKRLCSDAEWLRACQGPDGTTYPYGDVRQPGVCNDARAQHPAVELFPDDPNPFSHLQDACINQLPDALDPAGANAACLSAEVAFDLMGNLHEWTSDPAGTFRGGFYVDTAINGNGCAYRTTAHDTAYWDYSTGFRCCADAR